MEVKFNSNTLGTKAFLGKAMKVFVTFGTLGFVFYKIAHEGHSLDWSFSLKESLLIGIAILLLPFNLGLEAFKWQILQRSIDSKFSFSLSIKGVLMGACLALFTPNRLGDYMGRLMVIKKDQRWESGSFILVNRLSQMLITLFLGIVAWQLAYQIKIIDLSLAWTHFINLISISSFLVLAAFFIFKKYLYRLCVQFFPDFRIIGKILSSLQSIHNKQLLQVCGLALMRYMVFSAQYILLLYALGAEGSIEKMTLLVLLVFLIKSLAPLASLAELGIREAVAVMVGGWLGMSGILATTGAFSLYLVNLVLPAAIGLILIYREKY
ncbi:MAG: flippase-like domain-containing protein [Bacteroidia bacterium]|nr:flippase-like domain-containing protein [Bacteroidia bacterium]